MIIEKKYIRLSIDVDADISDVGIDDICANIQNEVAYYYQDEESRDSSQAPDVVRTNVTRVFKLMSEDVEGSAKPKPKTKMKEVCNVCGSSVRLSPLGKLYKHDVLGNMPNFGNKIDRTAICDGSGKVPPKE